MSNEKARPGEQAAVGVAGGEAEPAWVPAPRFFADFECMRPGPAGPFMAWAEPYKNVVVDQGKANILNRMLGCTGAYTAFAFLGLHSATTASNHVWSNISASQVVSYGANVPLITFASTYTVASASATASYGFTAGTQTVSGAVVLFHTTNTMSTNAATANILEYSEGQFAASRQVQLNDTLNVTLTVSYA